MCFPALHCATWLIHRAGPLVTHRFSLSLSSPTIFQLMETRAEKDSGWAVSIGMTGCKGKASPGKPCLSGWLWREEAIGSIWVKLVYPWEESLALMHWTVNCSSTCQSQAVLVAHTSHISFKVIFPCWPCKAHGGMTWVWDLENDVLGCNLDLPFPSLIDWGQMTPLFCKLMAPSSLLHGICWPGEDEM